MLRIYEEGLDSLLNKSGTTENFVSSGKRRDGVFLMPSARAEEKSVLYSMVHGHLRKSASIYIIVE